MASFKNALQELLNACKTYMGYAQKITHFDEKRYNVVAQVIESLERTIKGLEVNDDAPPSEIEQLATSLNCLMEYHQFTGGKYIEWANSNAAFRLLGPQKEIAKEIIKKISALQPEQIKRFVTLYNQLPKPKRKKYNKLAKVLTNYSDILRSIKQRQKNAAKILALSKEFSLLREEFNCLGINQGEHDLIVIAEEKCVEIDKLLGEIKEFKTNKAEKLPSYFYTIDKFKIIQNRYNNCIELLTLAHERTTKNLEDPSIQPMPHEGHDYVLKSIKGALFEAPKRNKKKQEVLIAENDALQGSLGDCYLIASLIGLAKKCPNIIRNAIKEKKQGDKTIYEVTLFFLDKKDKSKLVKQKVVVDNQFMVKSDNSTAYASRGDQGELWALVLEKAMAKALGSYKALAGGNTDWALRMLSGEFPVAHRITQGTSKDEIVALLKANQGKLITVSIGMPSNVNGLFTVKGADEATIESHYIAFREYIIYCKHAYVLESIDYSKLDSAGDKDAVITLHNPHNAEGTNEKYPKVSPLVLKYCAHKIVIL